MHHREQPLEVWGGLECTINRVRQSYFDQLQLAGHLDRIERDIACIAELGVRTLRTALHWERFAALEQAGADPWRLFDRTMCCLQQHGIEPIVGLVHHGSGPAHTSLLDPAFPEKLARYAAEVARRYPWATAYTPVNEPNTTARFSCLYTFWYPHHRSLRSYARALVQQIKATALAMKAIRGVQPAARLITTEDAGRITSTPQLAQVREMREQRRWLGTDLLCGTVTADHSLHAMLLENGIDEAELCWFAENPCPPDVLGLNYYLTSDRFLDHRLHNYPAVLAGGDTGKEPYIDIEALRACPRGLAGAEGILMDTWRRYGIPVAITECHLGDVPENQVRWLGETWQGAQDARDAGAKVAAVTSWALFGSYNWPCLCTRNQGTYEPGAFSVKGRKKNPEPTPVAAVIRQIASGHAPAHPALERSGWWNSPERLLYPAPRFDREDDPAFSDIAVAAA